MTSSYIPKQEEHVLLVKKVLEKLKKANLCVAINKSHFHVKEVDCLGYIISNKGISLSPEKVKSVRNWNPPNPNAPSAVKSLYREECICIIEVGSCRIGWQIREGEVILRVILHLFLIRHFVVRSTLKYLIAREVFMGMS